LNSSVNPKGVLREGREKNWMKKVPSQAKGIGTFSFWGGFEAGIQSTGSLPDLHLHFAPECDGRTKGSSRLLDLYEFRS
jgi:hypothetical protein